MNTALLLAVPGTSCDEAAQTFCRIDGRLSERFGSVRRLWAYTSGGVRRKLAERGRIVPAPSEALRTLQEEGVTHLVVKSLHMAPGMEYTELREDLDACRSGPGAFERAVLDRPLLESRDALARVVACLQAETPCPAAGDCALMLVAHGSRRRAARAVYDGAAAFCRHLDTPAFLGTMAPRSSLDSALEACRAEDVRRVYLVPFMVAAGRSAREEIGGPSPDSWQSAFEGAGIACTPVLKGLGDRDAIVDIWLDGIEHMLARVHGDGAAEGGA